MLTTLNIKNFKSIKNKNFSFRNLNLLMGLNGMGKSSLIHALLMLRQSPRLDSGELRLNGELINLGSSRDALYQYVKKDEDLEIGFCTKGKGYNFKFKYLLEADYFLTKEDVTLGQDFFDNIIYGDNFQYIKAERLGPQSIHQKSYSNVVNLKNVGVNGEYTAHFIDVYGNEEIHFLNLLHENSKSLDPVSNTEIIKSTLINQINLWLSEISPGVNVKVTSITSENVLLEYSFEQRNFGSTNKFKPTNVGFGISYVLPIITALLSARPGQLIIIENPEAHVHPRGQAELGKLIGLLAMNDVQLFVETHSDHVLNGIRVACKEVENLHERTALYYFDKKFDTKEQFSHVTDIQIDRNGELSEYPPNLLEEWSNQLVKLV